MSIYEYSAKTITGEDKSLADYQGKVLLIVNTASKCGFTPQYKGLQALYEKYRDQGLVVLGFPSNQFGAQEPGTHDEIQSFCELNFGVTFPLFAKIDVKGPNADPVFKYLTDNAPRFLTKTVKWNFTKFLVDRNGRVVKRYAPTAKPEKLEAEIETLLAQK